MDDLNTPRDPLHVKLQHCMSAAKGVHLDSFRRNASGAFRHKTRGYSTVWSLPDPVERHTDTRVVPTPLSVPFNTQQAVRNREAHPVAVPCARAAVGPQRTEQVK